MKFVIMHTAWQNNRSKGASSQWSNYFRAITVTAIVISILSIFLRSNLGSLYNLQQLIFASDTVVLITEEVAYNTAIFTRCSNAWAWYPGEGCPSVCLPVRETRDLWQNERKFCGYYYTIWKNICHDFPTRIMVGGRRVRRPLVSEILGQTDPADF